MYPLLLLNLPSPKATVRGGEVKVSALSMLDLYFTSLPFLKLKNNYQHDHRARSSTSTIDFKADTVSIREYAIHVSSLFYMCYDSSHDRRSRTTTTYFT